MLFGTCLSGFFVFHLSHVEHFMLLHHLYHFPSQQNILRKWQMGGFPSLFNHEPISSFSLIFINNCYIPEGLAGCGEEI